MKLRMLREHYKRGKNGVWLPKYKFKTLNEIKKVTGFNLAQSSYYKCTQCDHYHLVSRRESKINEL